MSLFNINIEKISEDLSKDANQRAIILAILQDFEDVSREYGIDAEGVVNRLAAIYKANNFLLDYWLKNHSKLDIDRKQYVQLLDDAIKDWPSAYDRWVDGSIAVSPFLQRLFEAYDIGSNEEKTLLKVQYPNYFVYYEPIANSR